MPNNAEAARKRRMAARVCGNCGGRAHEMRSWGRGPSGGIPICRTCGGALDIMQVYAVARGDQYDAFAAGLDAADRGEPCLPPDDFLESRATAVLWVDGWISATRGPVPALPTSTTQT